MTRRRTTLGLATVILLLLVLAGGLLHVPYIILVPGPVTDTLGNVPQGLLAKGQPEGPVIKVSGVPAQPVSGHLYLTTVDEIPGSCSSHPTLFQAVKAWFSKSETVDPYQVLCPPGESTQAVHAEDAQEMVQSQTDAVTAALLELGRTPTSEHVSVGSVEPSVPAAEVLKPADVILAVDGTTVTTVSELRALVAKHPVGSTLAITIQRDGKTSVVHTRTIAGGSGSTPSIGITADRVATFAGVKVSIAIDPDVVGGPSAGTALALGVIDKLTPGGLTGGRTIAGTGTVDGFGNVGPIGGIQQKIAGAVRAHATVFFAPADECPDAKAAAPKSLTLVKITTLHSAVEALQAIKAGSTAFPHC